MSKSDSDHEWGLLPGEVTELVLNREWKNQSNLKARLLKERAFPVTVHLKAPKGNKAVRDLDHFQRFVKSWQSFPKQNLVKWEKRNYRSLLEQDVPCVLELKNFAALVDFLGPAAIWESKHWEAMMQPLLDVDKKLYPVLIKHLSTVGHLDDWSSRALALVSQQLKRSMGQGLYLRALPLTGVHTKFVETYIPILTDVLDMLHDGEVTGAGGLLSWLGCIEQPKGWLYVRPLCHEAQEKIGGFPILCLANDTLRSLELPASNILIVENLQAGLAMPSLPDTITVFGGGKNVAWTDAQWLRKKHVAYWGDIDTWGLSILSDVRKNIPHVMPLMMDRETFSRFEHFSTHEDESHEQFPAYLTAEEQALFSFLTETSNALRLEQEYCAADYVKTMLEKWLDSD